LIAADALSLRDPGDQQSRRLSADIQAPARAKALISRPTAACCWRR
jgi:hypothetical protein